MRVKVSMVALRILSVVTLAIIKVVELGADC